VKALALTGSLAFAIYVVVTLALTFHNVSRLVFGLGEDPEDGTNFLARQTTIILWPLVAISSEGREFLRVIWKGNK
jgi:hypothetical protein